MNEPENEPGSALVPSAPTGVPAEPQDWDKAVSAAYFRALGASQEAAAKAAGVSERTLWAYEKASWWPRAHQEAVGRWHVKLTAASRKALLRAIRGGDGKTALDVLERVDPRLAKKGGLPDDELMRELGQVVVDEAGVEVWERVWPRWVDLLSRRIA